MKQVNVKEITPCLQAGIPQENTRPEIRCDEQRSRHGRATIPYIVARLFSCAHAKLFVLATGASFTNDTRQDVLAAITKGCLPDGSHHWPVTFERIPDMGETFRDPVSRFPHAGETSRDPVSRFPHAGETSRNPFGISPTRGKRPATRLAFPTRGGNVPQPVWHFPHAGETSCDPFGISPTRGKHHATRLAFPPRGGTVPLPVWHFRDVAGASRHLPAPPPPRHDFVF
jgi:hypothetical protein